MTVEEMKLLENLTNEIQELNKTRYQPTDKL